MFKAMTVDKGQELTRVNSVMDLRPCALGERWSDRRCAACGRWCRRASRQCRCGAVRNGHGGPTRKSLAIKRLEAIHDHIAHKYD